MSKNDRYYYKVSSLTAALPGSCAVFIEPVSLEVMKVPVIVWASVNWYSQSDNFVDSEVVGLTAIPESISLQTNDIWRDNFVCYLFAEDEVDRELVEPVLERMKQIKEKSGISTT